MAELLLNDLPAGADVIADKGYDADWIRDLIEDQDCTPHIPPKSNRYDGITYSKTKYKKRNLIERCLSTELSGSMDSFWKRVNEEERVFSIVRFYYTPTTLEED